MVTCTDIIHGQTLVAKKYLDRHCNQYYLFIYSELFIKEIKHASACCVEIYASIYQHSTSALFLLYNKENTMFTNEGKKKQVYSGRGKMA